MKLKFKEKTSIIHEMELIFLAIVVSTPFLVISIINSENNGFLPFALGWCVLVLLFLFYYLNRFSNVVLNTEVIMAPNRGYYRSSNDVSGKVVIQMGKILIPYKELTEIRVEEKNVYIKFSSLCNEVILKPIKLEEFLLKLREKISNIGLDIPIYIIQNKDINDGVLTFKNNVLTNKYTIMAFMPFVAFLYFGVILNLMGGINIGTLFFAIITVVVTIIFFIAISLYKVTLTLSDESIIELSKIGDADLGIKKISYNDIVKITKKSWGVVIKTRAGGSVNFISTDNKFFYSELQNKLNKNKY